MVSLLLQIAEISLPIGQHPASALCGRATAAAAIRASLSMSAEELGHQL